jgi:O-antigen ligase
MWRTSFLVTEDAPIFGIGYDKRAEKIRQLIEEKKINPGVGDFYNMHSDYMEEVSIRGIVGLVLLILLYFFMIKLSFVKKHTEGIVMPLLAIPVTLALLGLPDNFLINRSAFFVFCILYLLSFALNRQRFLDSE